MLDLMKEGVRMLKLISNQLQTLINNQPNPNWYEANKPWTPPIGPTNESEYMASLLATEPLDQTPPGGAQNYHELCLCEHDKVIPHPGEWYIFRYEDNCRSCRRKMEVYKSDK